MSTTQLVTITPQALAQGGIGFSDDQLSPSPLELVQRTTQVEGAIPGKFRDKESNMHFDVMEIIPLAFSKSRVLFPPGGDLQKEPLCRSNDGFVPANNVLQRQASRCDLCPRGSWEGYNKSTGEGKPDCAEQLKLLFIERSTGLPYHITVKGRSLTPMKMFQRTLAKFNKISQGKGLNLNIFDYTTTMKSLPVKGPKGSYFVVQFAPPVAIKEEDRGKFGPLYEAFVLMRAAKQNQVEQQVEAEDQLEDA
jgi:hypothetical protein